MSNFHVATLRVAGSVAELLNSMDSGGRRIMPWVKEAVRNHQGVDIPKGDYTLIGIPIEQLGTRDEKKASYSNNESYEKIGMWAEMNMPWGGTLEKVPLGVILAAAAHYGFLFGNYPNDTMECVHFWADPERDNQGNSVRLFISASPGIQWTVGGSRGTDEVRSPHGTLIACLYRN